MRAIDVGTAVQDLALAWLALGDEMDRREHETLTEAIADGRRVVDVHQGRDDEPAWTVTNTATGAVLAQAPPQVDDAVASLDAAWEDHWFDSDAAFTPLYDGASEPKDSFGLPPGMAKLIGEWVLENREEARRIVAS